MAIYYWLRPNAVGGAQVNGHSSELYEMMRGVM